MVVQDRFVRRRPCPPYATAAALSFRQPEAIKPFVLRPALRVLLLVRGIPQVHRHHIRLGHVGPLVPYEPTRLYAPLPAPLVPVLRSCLCRVDPAYRRGEHTVTDTSVVLENLVKPWHVQVASTTALVGRRGGRCGQGRQGAAGGRTGTGQAQTGVAGVPAVEVGQSVTVTPWEVLHALGRATVLSRQGAGRGLAEHWGCLKYCQALEGSSRK